MDHDPDAGLPALDAAAFAALRGQSRPFSLVILRKGPAFGSPDLTDLADPVTSIIYAHGMRNTRLFMAGIMPIVCPVSDDPVIAGIGVLDRSPEEASAIMEADPAIKAGILAFELYPTRTFTIPERSPADRIA